MSRHDSRMCICEILGVPGVGKTSLIKEIYQNKPSVRVIAPRSLSSFRSMISYLITFPALAHLLLGISPKKLGGWFTAPDILALSQLLWWKGYLTRRGNQCHLNTIIDEGPVGLLSWSIEFGSHHYKRFQSSSFFDQYYDYIAQVFKTVVTLQIHPVIALDRIRNRDQNHWIGKLPVDAAVNLLNRIHHAQSQATSILASRYHSIEIIQIDVQNKSTQDIFLELTQNNNLCLGCP